MESKVKILDSQLKVGDVVKGSYHGQHFEGKLKNIIPWRGNQYIGFFIYYVQTKDPIEVWKGNKVFHIVIMPHTQLDGTCTIQKVV